MKLFMAYLEKIIMNINQIDAVCESKKKIAQPNESRKRIKFYIITRVMWVGIELYIGVKCCVNYSENLNSFS